jgi:hypothetical protein
MKELTIGAKVRYFPMYSDRSVFIEHEVVEEPYKVFGETVVRLNGKGGPVSVDDVELVDEQTKTNS